MFRFIAMMLLLGNAAVGMDRKDVKEEEGPESSNQRAQSAAPLPLSPNVLNSQHFNPYALPMPMPMPMQLQDPMSLVLNLSSRIGNGLSGFPQPDEQSFNTQITTKKEDSSEESLVQKKLTQAEKQNSINIPLRILTGLLENDTRDEIIERLQIKNQYVDLTILLGDDERRQTILDRLREDYCPEGKLNQFISLKEKSPFYKTLKAEQKDTQQSIVKSLLNILNGDILFIVDIYNQCCCQYAQGKKGEIKCKQWINQKGVYKTLTTDFIAFLKTFLSPSEKGAREDDVKAEEGEGEPGSSKRFVGNAGVKSMEQQPEREFPERKIMATNGNRAGILSAGVRAIMNLMSYHCEHVLKNSKLLSSIKVPTKGLIYKKDLDRLFDDIENEDDRKTLAQETWNILKNLSENIETYNLNLKSQKKKNGGRKKPIDNPIWAQDTECLQSIKTILIKHGAKEEEVFDQADSIPVIVEGQEPVNDHNDDNKSEDSNLFS